MSGEGKPAKGPGKAPNPLKDPEVGREIHARPGGSNHSPQARLGDSLRGKHCFMAIWGGTERESNFLGVTQQAAGAVGVSVLVS